MKRNNYLFTLAMTLLMAFAGLRAGAQPRLFVGPNEPLGRGVGIHPGRVAWIHSPGVASWDGQTGLWVEDRWNDQRKADAMVREAIVQLTGERSAKKAWAALFRHFNKTRGRGNRGYRKGERIAIKLNMNNALTHRDTIELNSSPFVTLALVRSLVHDGGVREADITVCEPSRAITDSIFDKCHREFPDVVFIDNIGGDGRQKCEYYGEQIKYSAPTGKLARGLAKCIVDADYLINSALLKTHKGPGVTLTAKNWYGATDINLQWRKNAHNGFSPDKKHGKPGYKTFVDFIGQPRQEARQARLQDVRRLHRPQRPRPKVPALHHRRHLRLARRERSAQPQVAETALQRRLVLLAHSLARPAGVRRRGHGPAHRRVAGVRQLQLLRRVPARGGHHPIAGQRHEV